MGTLDSTNFIKIDEAAALNKLLKKVTGKYESIVTTGRGGLSIAQKLAYKLDIPVEVVTLFELSMLNRNSLFVDDIVCTGNTISMIPRGVDVAVLVARKSSNLQPTYAGLVYIGDEYIKFSWEI